MNYSVTPTAESDLADVRRLMLSAFDLEDGAAPMEQALLRWKYADGSRGFDLRERGKIVAHCGAPPVVFLLPGGEVRGVCVIDWVRRRGHPGVGSLLLRRVMEMNRVAVVAGGTEATLSAISRLAFVPCGSLEYFLRSLRPWRRFLNRPRSAAAWKAGARLARDFVWSLSRSSRPESVWSAIAVSRFSDGDCRNRPAAGITLTRRQPEELNSWLRCPGGELSGFLVARDGRTCGHFLLNRLGHSVRIADIRVDGESPEDWLAAYSLAAQKAAENPETHEIIALASAPPAGRALRANGFHAWGRANLFLHDPEGIMAGHAPIHWNPIDDDSAIV